MKKHAVDAASNIPVLVLTGHDNEARVLNAISKGTEDYLVKDQINGNMLSRVMRHGIEREHAQK